MENDFKFGYNEEYDVTIHEHPLNLSIPAGQKILFIDGQWDLGSPVANKDSLAEPKFSKENSLLEIFGPGTEQSEGSASWVEIIFHNDKIKLPMDFLFSFLKYYNIKLINLNLPILFQYYPVLLLTTLYTGLQNYLFA